MPDLDLEPSAYRERKPKGWRWRLPWAHPEDNKLPLVMFIVALGFIGYFFINLPVGTDIRICGGLTVFAFGAGGMFQLFMRD